MDAPAESRPDSGLSHGKIIHIDMAAFYASVEQRDNPDLRGKAVAVGGAAERGVVAAASYEARKFGVRSAMASVTAKRQCPNLIFVKPRFEVYKAISRQIRDIFAEHTPIIEPLSLDEAYLDVTENLQGIPSSATSRCGFARRSSPRRASTLRPASATTNFWRSLLRITGSRTASTSSLRTWAPRSWSRLPVGKFHGIGPATSAKMNGGIFTGKDIRNQTLEFMNANFGNSGAYYYWISRGIDDRPRPRQPHPQIHRRREHVLGGPHDIRGDGRRAPATDRQGLASL